MADTFPVSGNIESTTFPHILVDLHRQGATGSLKVNGPQHTKALYFRGGRILFGSSKDPRDQLGVILIESGKITREQLDEVNEKVGPGNPLAKVLAESGFVNQRELGDAARVKVESILSDVLSWEAGNFEFEDGVLPKGAVDLKLSTERLLLAAVQRIGDRAFALRHLGGDMTTVLEAAPEGEAALTDVRAEVWPLLERLDGERTLQDAVALTRLEEFQAAKTACAMLFLGIVRRKGGAASDELDLAEQALSGFGEQPPEGGAPEAEAPLFKPEEEAPPAEVPLFKPEEEAPPAEVPLFKPEEPTAPPEAQPDSLIVPSEAAPSFAELDAEAAADPGPSLAFPSPEPDAPALDSEPLGVPPEADVPSAFPIVEPDSEPLGVAPESVAAATRVEPTGFDFVQPEAPASPGGEPPVAVPEAPMSPADEPTMALPTEPAPEPPAPPMESPVPSFAVDAPSRKKTDTVPGDRPVYTPPAAEPPAASGPEISAFGASASAPEPEAPAAVPAPSTPDASGRPTQEDLAALDELLHPSGSAAAKKTVERPRAERWEPQFRTSDAPAPAGPSGSSRRAVGRRGRSSKAPILAGVAGLVIAGSAAGYFLLGRSSTSTPSAQPTTAPTAAPTPALSAPATVAPAPSAVPSPVLPSPAATAVPAAAVPAATPAPTAAPTPFPTPVPPPPATTPAGPAASTGEARALLRQGALAPAAQGFASSLASARDGYSIQTLVACSPENVQKAVQNVGGDELFVLPVNLDGRSCYRVCWGVFDSQPAAEAALPSLPPYFQKGMVQPLASLLP
jgi:hypothetical protein